MGVWVCGCVGQVPKGKRTNESLNDSLAQEKGGRWPGAKRLVGGREVVGVRVPVEKDTNESQ